MVTLWASSTRDIHVKFTPLYFGYPEKILYLRNSFFKYFWKRGEHSYFNNQFFKNIGDNNDFSLGEFGGIMNCELLLVVWFESSDV